MFGVRTGFYTDVDEPFIGIEGLFGLGNHVYLNPNFEYVFTEDPHYMTFNADFHYDFPTRSRATSGPERVSACSTPIPKWATATPTSGSTCCSAWASKATWSLTSRER